MRVQSSSGACAFAAVPRSQLRLRRPLSCYQRKNKSRRPRAVLISASSETWGDASCAAHHGSMFRLFCGPLHLARLVKQHYTDVDIRYSPNRHLCTIGPCSAAGASALPIAGAERIPVQRRCRRFIAASEIAHSVAIHALRTWEPRFVLSRRRAAWNVMCTAMPQ